MADSSQLNKNSKRALQILGYLFLRMGQFARARRLFAALNALDPQDPIIRQSLAYAAIQMNDGEAAIHALSGIIVDDDTNKGHATIHLLLARAHKLLGEDKEAQESMAAFWKTVSQAENR
ncbi:MAG: tetratricopeptide repeat protein [Desulfovibrionaceae bacterium]|nr:tetratricopeptide repeat protein [Desulfovibrionaceae bacterium]